MKKYTKCSVNGCDGLGAKAKNGGRYFPKGFCKMHYYFYKTYGDPFARHRAKNDNRTKTRAYSIYQNMKNRCTNPKCNRWQNYGGRGIKICSRWLGQNGFNNFLKDMGEPDASQSLDRINPNGDYTPRNCRWATKWEQAWNHIKTSNTGVRGVTELRDGYYMAYITVNGVTVHKCFKSLTDAEEWRVEKENKICR